MASAIYETEVPSTLKRLVRKVVRGFFATEDVLIIDMLVRYPCIREEDLANLLKYPRKMLRSRMALLRSDKFVQSKQRIETDEDGKVVKMSCYFIHYKNLVNVCKYKLDHMHKKMETSERDATNRSSFRCNDGCGKAFTDLEADQLFDPQSMEFRCTFCSSIVEEDTSGGPQQDSRQLLARFNEQMEPIYDLLRTVEGVSLAQSLLEPDPVTFAIQDGVLVHSIGQNNRDPVPSAANQQGIWSGDHSRNRSAFDDTTQNVNITFDESGRHSTISGEPTDSTTSDSTPIWLTKSTVISDDQDQDRSDGGSTAPGPESSSMAADQSDEITSMLLKHEKINKSARDGASQPELGPGASGGSVDNEMTPEQPVVMLPTVFVAKAGQQVSIADVDEDTIDLMTDEEREQFTHIYQDYYNTYFE